MAAQRLLFRVLDTKYVRTVIERIPGWSFAEHFIGRHHRRIVLSLAGAALVIALIELFWNVTLSPLLRIAVLVMDHLLVFAIVVELALVLAARPHLDTLRERWYDIALTLPALALLGAGWPRAAGALAIVRQGGAAYAMVMSLPAVQRATAKVTLSPIRLLVLSFFVTIAVGALFLMAPAATVDGRGATLLTALFTATSATCVTGLVVVDTGSHFTPFGQAVILALIQIGGLGIMTITTGFRHLFRRRVGLRERGAMQEVLEAATAREFRSTLAGIGFITVALEAAGALVLWLRFLALGVPGGDPFRAAAWAVFHSVSAFNNAGFGLYSDSLVRFAGDTAVNVTVMALIVVGGLGFTVVAGLWDPQGLRGGLRAYLRRQSEHAKLVLVATVSLIVFGAVVFFWLEFDASLRGLSLGDKLLASLFQSITPRTAGFNSVDLMLMRPATVLLVVVLMYIGGSPGGTAGGVKTSTMVVLGLAVRAMLLRRPEVEIFGRSLVRTHVYRAVAVTFISFVLISVLFGLLLLAEPAMRFEHLLFESVSAFATVGLTLNVTPQLGVAGKLIVMLFMFVGRLGPFTLALAVGERGESAQYHYPRGKVLVG
jgi:trk system potassium uptake protein TrkH